MKKLFLNTALVLMMTLAASSALQSQNFKDLDSSPHDIVYFRANKISPPVIKVLYGRPQKNGRTIFGEVVPYGQIWRVGANEATEVVFYEDVLFGDQQVKAGTYVLYAIPEQKEWTLILSSNTDVWGAAGYEKKYEVARAKGKVSQAEFLEAFSIGFKEKGKQVNMVLAWDTTRVTAPIKIDL